MTQREVGSFPVARAKSLRVSDERRQEELARGVIRRFLLQPGASDDPTSTAVDGGVPITPSLDGNVPELESTPSVEPSPSPALTSTPCTAAKPKKLYLAPTKRLSPIHSPSLQTTNSQDEEASLTDSHATFTRDTPFRHSAVVLPSSCSRRSEREEDSGLSEPQSERLRSNSCVYPSAGTHIPPDQRELVPMQIAEWLRDIADNQVEPSLRQQGLLDQLARRGTDVQVLNDGDIIQTLDRQLEGLIRDGRPQTPNAGTLECAAVYWAQGLILAKAVLHGLESTRPAEMEQLQQGLEDVLVDVFRRNQLMGWLSNPMGLFASCKNRVGAAVASCRDHLATWSPRLLGRRPVLTRQSASDGAMEQSMESGYFEQSTSVPSSPTSTPTATRRRTSSISDLVSTPLMAAGATMVGAAATYYAFKNATL